MSSIGGVGSALTTQSQTDQNQSVAIPAGLTPAQEAQVAEVLGELSSGSITPAEAEAEIASIAAPEQQSNSTQSTLSSALDLTSKQESQISSIIQNAQKNGASPNDVLSQIEGVLTPTQQQKLAQLLSPTYSSTGMQTKAGQPPLFRTIA